MTDDEQEAGSRKYIAPQVVPLKSGRFAIYNLFSNADGLVLLCICEESELPNRLRTFILDIDVADRRAEEERQYRLANPPAPRARASRAYNQTESLA